MNIFLFLLCTTLIMTFALKALQDDMGDDL